MTEKDFRRLVTDLELSKEEKNSLLELLNKVEIILNKSYLYNFQIIEVSRCGSFAKGTILNDVDELDIMVKAKLLNNLPFIIENEILLNAITNAFLKEIDTITKLSDVEKNSKQNVINVLINNIKLNLYLVYEDGDFSSIKEEKRIKFCEIANRDYTYFKNTVQIIKYYKNSQNIKINGYLIEILLYYSLNEYFKDNRYEDYINNFIKAIDDFLKGKIIQVSNDVYQKLDIIPAAINKKGYMIIDVSDGLTNLTANITELGLSEFRKLKKALSKLVDNKVNFKTNTQISLNINPVLMKDSENYQWSYRIENSEYANTGGSFENTKNDLLNASYKALYKGLRAIVDNNLNRNNIEVITMYKDLLLLNDSVSSENRARIKNIQSYIDNNCLVVRIK